MVNQYYNLGRVTGMVHRTPDLNSCGTWEHGPFHRALVTRSPNTQEIPNVARSSRALPTNPWCIALPIWPLVVALQAWEKIRFDVFDHRVDTRDANRVRHDAHIAKLKYFNRYPSTPCSSTRSIEHISSLILEGCDLHFTPCRRQGVALAMGSFNQHLFWGTFSRRQKTIYFSKRRTTDVFDLTALS